MAKIETCHVTSFTSLIMAMNGSLNSRSLQEMWTLARENGVMLPDDFVQQNLGAISKFPAGSTSSMHQDFRKGLPLEVESLQGAAIRLSAKHGLEVPTVRTLYGLLKPFEGRTNLNSN